MPTNATLGVWMQDGRLKQMMGYGHAGLEIPSKGKWIWVTWNGSPDPINKACGSVGMTMMKMPAHIDVGFDQYRNRRSGDMQPNTRFAWNYPGRDGFGEEKGSRGEPTTSIEITVANAKATGRAKNFYGLFTKEIEDWWSDLMTLAPEHPRRQFRLLSTGRDDNLRNCCATVVEALKLGGMEIYCPAPTNILFQGSNTLVRWVRDCQARIDELNEQRNQIISQADWELVPCLSNGVPQPDFADEYDLPSQAVWKKLSEVKATLRTGLARRHEEVARIDDLLPRYHAARAARAPGNAAPWFSLLTQIQQQCFMHLAGKPTSDRRMAVMGLAKQVLAIVQGFKNAGAAG